MSPRLLIALACTALLAAADAGTPLEQADVVLRIRDGRWVDREATRFAAAYGSDLAAVRSELARVLFRSRSFAGIDLSRPSVLAWRSGKSPMIAVIPISSRTAFLDAFGAVEGEDSPLVRVGERDGTVIYTQNQADGLWEYRLLVANNTAYLARTLDECHRMSEAPLPTDDAAAPPLELNLHGGGLLAPRLPGRDWLSALPTMPLDPGALANVPGLLNGAWKDIASQLAAMSITARSGSQGDLQLGFAFATRSDSPLAGWMAQQRPGTERLAGQLRSPATALLISGRFSFQGQLERWAFNQVDALKSAAGARWSDSADTAFRGICTLAERSGACAVEVSFAPDGSRIQRWVVEHPRSIEVAQSLSEVAGALAGRPVEASRLGNQPAFGVQRADSTSLFVAGDRHAIRVDEYGNHAAAAAAADLLRHLDEPGTLDAAPSLASLWIDLGKAWKAPPAGENDVPVVVTGLLRPAGPGRLEFDCSIPIQRMAALLARIKKPQRSNDD